jgi:hypothetical protein
LKEGVDVGATDIDLPAQPLVALNVFNSRRQRYSKCKWYRCQSW